MKKGGHPIPNADVRRRFSRNLKNLGDLYAPPADSWQVWDNRLKPPSRVERQPMKTVSKKAAKPFDALTPVERGRRAATVMAKELVTDHKR